MMAWWRSRHFTVVATLGPRWVELGHSEVVVSWLLYFHVLVKSAPIAAEECLPLLPLSMWVLLEKLIEEMGLQRQ